MNPNRLWVPAAAALVAVLCLAVCAVPGTEAATAEEDGLIYQLHDDGTAEVAGYAGEPVYVIIPSQVEADGVAYTVTSIGYAAFSAYETLLSVTMPDTVTTIHDGAFAGCTGLRALSIPGSVVSMGTAAFSGCSSLETIAIGSGLTSIGQRCFSQCSSLTSFGVSPENGSFASVDGVLFSKDLSQLLYRPAGLEGGYAVPDTVTSIGNYAFAYSAGLTSVSIPSSVESIGVAAFFHDSALSEIRYGCPDAQVGILAFNLSDGNRDAVCTVYGPIGCIDGHIDSSTHVDYIDMSGEAWVAIMDGISYTISGGAASVTCLPQTGEVSIPAYLALDGDPVPVTALDITEDDHSVTVLDLPATMADVGESFSHLAALSEAEVDPDNPRLESSDGVLYDKGMTTLVAHPISRGVGDVRIPDGVERIAEGAFRGCSSIVTVACPGSLRSVGDHAFEYCWGLETVTLPAGVESICSGAFASCLSLREIVFDGGNPAYTFSDGALVSSDGVLVAVCGGTRGTFTVPEGVTSVDPEAFIGCIRISTVVLNGTVEGITGSLFDTCTSLTSFEAPAGSSYSVVDGVLMSADGSVLVAYPMCRGREYTVPGSVTEIGESAFEGAELMTVVLHGGITSIGDRAFEWSLLTEVRYHCTGAEVGELAFESYAYRIVVILDDIADAGILDGAVEDTEIAYGFDDDATGLIYYVADGAVTLYGYHGTESVVVVPSSVMVSGSALEVAAIDDQAFYMNASLVSVEVPSTVTSIGSLAFFGCGSLAEVTLHDGLVEIGNMAFSGTAIAEISIPGTVGTMASAFQLCESLEVVRLGEGMQSLEGSPFAFCGSLTAVHLPSSLHLIGRYAFNGCPLETIVCLSADVDSEGPLDSDGPLSITVYCHRAGVLDGLAGENVEIRYLTSPDRPSIGPGSGTCTDPVTVAIECDSPVAVIRYTLDGSAPAEDSPLYTGPFEVTGDTVVTAAAFIDGMGSGETDSVRYIFLEGEIPENGEYAMEDGAVYRITGGGADLIRLPEGALTYDVPSSIVVEGASIPVLHVFGSVEGMEDGPLTAMTIPETVLYVNESALAALTSLESVDVAEGNLDYFSVDGVLMVEDDWYGDGVTLILYPSARQASQYTVPDCVARIAGESFSGVRCLSHLDLGSVESVASFAFSDMGSLASVHVPETVRTLPHYAFYSCPNLVEVTGMEGLTAISEGCFQDCESLAGVHIPGSVRSIGGSAFSGCTSLAEVTGCDRVAQVGAEAFSGCDRLLSFPWTDLLRTVGPYAFEGTGLEGIRLGFSVEHVDPTAFVGCTPSSVVLACPDVTDLMFLYGIDGFEMSVEDGCPLVPDGRAVLAADGTPLWSEVVDGVFIVPASATEVPFGVIHCSGATDILVEEGGVYSGHRGLLLRDGGTSLQYAMPSAVAGGALTVPATVTDVDMQGLSFADYTSFVLEEGSALKTDGIALYSGDWSEIIGFPGSYTGDYAIRDGTLSVGDYAFYRSCIDSVTIPSSVERVGDCAFLDSVSLGTFRIGSVPSEIGMYAFHVQHEFLEVYVSSMEQYLCLDDHVGGRIVSYCCEDPEGGIACRIADGSLWAFQRIDADAADVVIPSHVRLGGEEIRVIGILEYGFLYTGGIESVTIAEGIETIGVNAFLGCPSLSGVTIPSTVTSIGRLAFADCPLTTIVWKAGDCTIDTRFGTGEGTITVYTDNPGALDGYLLCDAVEYLPLSDPDPGDDPDDPPEEEPTFPVWPFPWEDEPSTPIVPPAAVVVPEAVGSEDDDTSGIIACAAAAVAAALLAVLLATTRRK